MLKILPYVALLIALQLLGTAFALQCYNCKGEQGINDDCEVNLENVNVQKCDFSCAVYISQVGDVTTINRFCGSPNDCDEAANSHTTNTKTISCKMCNSTDLCNSANTRVLHPNMILFTCIAFSFVFAKVF